MACATAICATKALYWQDFFSNTPGDLALQIKRCFCGEDLLKAREGQKVVDVPSFGCPDASHNLKVPIYPSQTSPTLRRAGIAVVAACKTEKSQGPHHHLP
jgi:hypothetical protein